MELYIKEKLKIIKDFGIKLTPNEKAKIMNCDNEETLEHVTYDILHSERNSSPLALYSY